MKITIDEEFQNLIPAMTSEELKQLEDNIVAEGCRDPLVIWFGQNILLDGHNRYKICQKYNIQFEEAIDMGLYNRIKKINMIIPEKEWKL